MGLPSSANNDLAFPFALLEAAPRSTLFSLLKTLVFLCALMSGSLDGKYDSGDRKACAAGTAAGVIFL